MGHVVAVADEVRNAGANETTGDEHQGDKEVRVQGRLEGDDGADLPPADRADRLDALWSRGDFVPGGRKNVVQTPRHRRYALLVWRWRQSHVGDDHCRVVFWLDRMSLSTSANVKI